MTAPQFYREVGALRRLWGNKSFWENDRTVELAVKALGVSYLNTECGDPEEQERVASVFEATMREFTRRELFVREGI